MADVGGDGASLLMGPLDPSAFTGRDQDLFLPGDSLFGFSAAAGIDESGGIAPDIGGESSPSFQGSPSMCPPPLSFEASASLPPELKGAIGGAVSLSRQPSLQNTPAGGEQRKVGAERAGVGGERHGRSTDRGSPSQAAMPSLLQSLDAVITSAAARDAARAALAAEAAANGTEESGAETPKAMSNRVKPGTRAAGGGGADGTNTKITDPEASSSSSNRNVAGDAAGVGKVVSARPQEGREMTVVEAVGAGTMARPMPSDSCQRGSGDSGRTRLKGAPSCSGNSSSESSRGSGVQKRKRGPSAGVAREQLGAPPCRPPTRRTSIREASRSGEALAVDGRARAETTSAGDNVSIVVAGGTSVPAGLELIPGFEDTIDSAFMTALLEGSDSLPGASFPATANGFHARDEGGEGEGKVEENAGQSSRQPSSLADALRKARDTQSRKGEAAAGGRQRQHDRTDLASEGFSCDLGGGSAVVKAGCDRSGIVANQSDCPDDGALTSVTAERDGHGTPDAAAAASASSGDVQRVGLISTEETDVAEPLSPMLPIPSPPLSPVSMPSPPLPPSTPPSTPPLTRSPMRLSPPRGDTPGDENFSPGRAQETVSGTERYDALRQPTSPTGRGTKKGMEEVVTATPMLASRVPEAEPTLPRAGIDQSGAVAIGRAIDERRPLPRKVALRFAPRDACTEKKVAERGYLPFQKLTAPLSKPLQAVFKFMVKKWSEVAFSDLSNIRIVLDIAASGKDAGSVDGNDLSAPSDTSRQTCVWGAERSGEPLADLMNALPSAVREKLCKEEVLDLTYTFLTGSVGPPPNSSAAPWAVTVNAAADTGAAAAQPTPRAKACAGSTTSSSLPSASVSRSGSENARPNVEAAQPTARHDVGGEEAAETVPPSDGGSPDGGQIPRSISTGKERSGKAMLDKTKPKAKTGRKRRERKPVEAMMPRELAQRPYPLMPPASGYPASRAFADVSHLLAAQTMGMPPLTHFMPGGLFARMHTAAVANGIGMTGPHGGLPAGIFGPGFPLLTPAVPSSAPASSRAPAAAGTTAAVRDAHPQMSANVARAQKTVVDVTAKMTVGNRTLITPESDSHVDVESGVIGSDMWGGRDAAVGENSSGDLAAILGKSRRVGGGDSMDQCLGIEKDNEGSGRKDEADVALMGEDTCMALFGGGGGEVELMVDPSPPPSPSQAGDVEKASPAKDGEAVEAAEENDTPIAALPSGGANVPPSLLDSTSAAASTIVGAEGEALDGGGVFGDDKGGDFGVEANADRKGGEGEGKGGGVVVEGALMGEETCMALFGNGQVELFMEPFLPPSQVDDPAGAVTEDVSGEGNGGGTARDTGVVRLISHLSLPSSTSDAMLPPEASDGNVSNIAFAFDPQPQVSVQSASRPQASATEATVETGATGVAEAEEAFEVANPPPSGLSHAASQGRTENALHDTTSAVPIGEHLESAAERPILRPSVRENSPLPPCVLNGDTTVLPSAQSGGVSETARGDVAVASAVDGAHTAVVSDALDLSVTATAATSERKMEGRQDGEGEGTGVDAGTHVEEERSLEPEESARYSGVRKGAEAETQEQREGAAGGWKEEQNAEERTSRDGGRRLSTATPAGDGSEAGHGAEGESKAVAVEGMPELPAALLNEGAANSASRQPPSEAFPISPFVAPGAQRSSEPDIVREAANGGGVAVTVSLPSAAPSMVAAAGAAGKMALAAPVRSASNGSADGGRCSNGGEPAVLGLSGGGCSRRPEEQRGRIVQKVHGRHIRAPVPGTPSAQHDSHETAPLTENGRAPTPASCSGSTSGGDCGDKDENKKEKRKIDQVSDLATAAAAAAAATAVSDGPPRKAATPAEFSESTARADFVASFAEAAPVAVQHPVPEPSRPFAFAAAAKKAWHGEAAGARGDSGRITGLPVTDLQAMARVKPRRNDVRPCKTGLDADRPVLPPLASSSSRKFAENPAPREELVSMPPITRDAIGGSTSRLPLTMSPAEVQAEYSEAWSSFPSCFWEEPIVTGDGGGGGGAGADGAGGPSGKHDTNLQVVAEGPVTRWLGLPRAEPTLDGQSLSVMMIPAENRADAGLGVEKSKKDRDSGDQVEHRGERLDLPRGDGDGASAAAADAAADAAAQEEIANADPVASFTGFTSPGNGSFIGFASSGINSAFSACLSVPDTAATAATTVMASRSTFSRAATAGRADASAKEVRCLPTLIRIGRSMTKGVVTPVLGDMDVSAKEWSLDSATSKSEDNDHGRSGSAAAEGVAAQSATPGAPSSIPTGSVNATHSLSQGIGTTTVPTVSDGAVGSGGGSGNGSGVGPTVNSNDGADAANSGRRRKRCLETSTADVHGSGSNSGGMSKGSSEGSEGSVRTGQGSGLDTAALPKRRNPKKSRIAPTFVSCLPPALSAEGEDAVSSRLNMGVSESNGGREVHDCSDRSPIRKKCGRGAW